MAAHLHTQIRTAALAALTGLTTTGANAFNARSLPLDPSELPALCVYTRSDEIVYEDGMLTQQPRHNLELRVEGYVKGDDEATADLIKAEVEVALYANQTFTGLTEGMELTSLENRVDDATDEVVTVCENIFTVWYYAGEGVPDVSLGAATPPSFISNQPILATLADLQSITSNVNTVNKRVDVVYIDSDNHRGFLASGTAAGDPWNNLDGTLIITPS